MTTPVRIERQRTRGWRLPAGAIYVGRPTRWGNPYVVGASISVSGDKLGEGAGFYNPHDVRIYDVNLPGPGLSAAQAVALYDADLKSALSDHERAAHRELRKALRALAGHDLACWCPLDQPCHADVLLWVANR